MTNSNTLSPFSQKPKEQLSARQVLDQQIGGSDELSGGRLGDFSEASTEPTFSTPGFAQMDQLFELASVISDQAEYKVEHFTPITSNADAQIKGYEIDQSFNSIDSIIFNTPDKIAKRDVEQRIASFAHTETNFNPVDQVKETPMAEIVVDKVGEIGKKIGKGIWNNRKQFFGAVGDLFGRLTGRTHSEKQPEDPKELEKRQKKITNIATFYNGIKQAFAEVRALIRQKREERRERLGIAGMSTSDINNALGEHRNAIYQGVNSETDNGEYIDEQTADGLARKRQEKMKPEVIATPVAKGGGPLNQQQMEGGMKGQAANLSAANSAG